MTQLPPESVTLKVSDFDFHLPEELIAQQPPAERGASRMLIVHREQSSDQATDQPFVTVGQGFSPGKNKAIEPGASAPEVSLPDQDASASSLTDTIFTDLPNY